MITILVALSATVGLFAQGNNLITNGGFEKIVKRSLAQDKTLQNLTKRGWDFGAGPHPDLHSSEDRQSPA